CSSDLSRHTQATRQLAPDRSRHRHSLGRRGRRHLRSHSPRFVGPANPQQSTLDDGTVSVSSFLSRISSALTIHVLSTSYFILPASIFVYEVGGRADPAAEPCVGHRQ